MNGSWRWFAIQSGRRRLICSLLVAGENRTIKVLDVSCSRAPGGCCVRFGCVTRYLVRLINSYISRHFVPRPKICMDCLSTCSCEVLLIRQTQDLMFGQMHSS